MKKKIMAALLAGVMLLQQPVSGWCAQNTELTQKSEARQESESSEDTADGSEDDKEATGTAAADDGENSQEEDSEDVPTLQAETDEVTLDTGTSDNAPEGQRKILDHIYAESVDLSGKKRHRKRCRPEWRRLQVIRSFFIWMICPPV